MDANVEVKLVKNILVTNDQIMCLWNVWCRLGGNSLNSIIGYIVFHTYLKDVSINSDS